MQKNQEFKVNLGYIVNLRPPFTTLVFISKDRDKKGNSDLYLVPLTHKMTEYCYDKVIFAGNMKIKRKNSCWLSLSPNDSSGCVPSSEA